jgi:hypothetical protein
VRSAEWQKEIRMILFLALLLAAQGDGLLEKDAASGYRVVAGTRVELAPPAGFVPSGTYPGFMGGEGRSSIMVTEIPGPFAEVSNGFTPESAAGQGMAFLQRDEMTIADHDGLLVHMRQEGRNGVFLKWAVLFGNDEMTVIITAAFPEERGEAFSAALRESVLQARWNPSKALDPFEGLPFTLAETEALRIATRSANTLLFTKDGLLPHEATQDPLLVAGASVSAVAIKDQERFASDRLQTTAGVADLTIRTRDTITIDGLPGRLIIADGQDEVFGAPSVVFQVMLFEGDSYYLIQGFSKAGDEEENLAAFRRVAESFTLRTPGGAGTNE